MSQLDPSVLKQASQWIKKAENKAAVIDVHEVAEAERAVITAEDAIMRMNSRLLFGVVVGAGYGGWLVKSKLSETILHEHREKAAQLRIRSASGGATSVPTPQDPVYKHAKIPSLMTLIKENKGMFIQASRAHALQAGVLMGVHTSISVSMQHFRKRNDWLNYAAAGLLAGAGLGAFRSGAATGVAFGVVFGGLSAWTFITHQATMRLLRNYNLRKEQQQQKQEGNLQARPQETRQL